MQSSSTLLATLTIKRLFLAGLKCVEIMAKLLAILFLTTSFVSIVISVVLLNCPMIHMARGLPGNSCASGTTN